MFWTDWPKTLESVTNAGIRDEEVKIAKNPTADKSARLPFFCAANGPLVLWRGRQINDQDAYLGLRPIQRISRIPSDPLLRETG
jgi:hypothetical protein